MAEPKRHMDVLERVLGRATLVDPPHGLKRVMKASSRLIAPSLKPVIDSATLQLCTKVEDEKSSNLS